MGIDLSEYSLDHPLNEVDTEAARSIVDWVCSEVQGRAATVRDIGTLLGKTTRLTGTPEQIAGQLETWRAVAIDGINVINATIPGSYSEFIEHIMPAVRQRGLAKTAYAPGTLRQKIFGADKLPGTHPAAAYRDAFTDSLDAS